MIQNINLSPAPGWGNPSFSEWTCNWTLQRKKKEAQIQLIFYCTKVSQGRSESHVNTIPECRFISLFYKSQRDESLSDHYYHTNRQIYLTTLFLSHNTYSLVLLPERHWNVCVSRAPLLLPLSPFFLFSFAEESSLGW